MDNCYSPRVELTGDIAQTLGALTPQLQRAGMPALSSHVLDMIHAERQTLNREAALRSGTPIHPLRLVHELQQFAGSDTTLCLDRARFTSGSHVICTASHPV